MSEMKRKSHNVCEIYEPKLIFFPPNYYNSPDFLQAIFLTAFVMLAASNSYAPFKKGEKSS